MGDRVDEDVIGGYVVVNKSECSGVADLWREKDRENGEQRLVGGDRFFTLGNVIFVVLVIYAHVDDTKRK